MGQLEDGAPWALTLSHDPVALRSDRDDRACYLSAYQHFELIPNPDYPGEWKAHTLEYVYAVSIGDPDAEFLSWHWHPEGASNRRTPHLHVTANDAVLDPLRRVHIPTGRVSFEEILRFLVFELGVCVRRDRELDWQGVLKDTEKRFKTFWSWA